MRQIRGQVNRCPEGRYFQPQHPTRHRVYSIITVGDFLHFSLATVADLDDFLGRLRPIVLATRVD